VYHSEFARSDTVCKILILPFVNFQILDFAALLILQKKCLCILGFLEVRLKNQRFCPEELSIDRTGAFCCRDLCHLSSRITDSNIRLLSPVFTSSKGEQKVPFPRCFIALDWYQGSGEVLEVGVTLCILKRKFLWWLKVLLNYIYHGLFLSPLKLVLFLS